MNRLTLLLALHAQSLCIANGDGFLLQSIKYKVEVILLFARRSARQGCRLRRPGSPVGDLSRDVHSRPPVRACDKPRREPGISRAGRFLPELRGRPRPPAAAVLTSARSWSLPSAVSVCCRCCRFPVFKSGKLGHRFPALYQEPRLRPDPPGARCSSPDP